MNGKVLSIILLAIGICIVLSPEVQAKKANISPSGVYITHKTGGGTYGYTSSAMWGYVGFKDVWRDSDDMTYRTSIWYDNIGDYFTTLKDAAGAIDRVYFNWTSSNNSNFNSGRLYDLPSIHSSYNHLERLDYQDWAPMSYSDKYSYLSGNRSYQNRLCTGIDPIGGRDRLPLERGFFLIRFYQDFLHSSGVDDVLGLALREYPESTDSSMSDDSSFVTFYPGDLEVYYAPQPTLTSPADGTDFSSGDSITLSWSSSDSDCSYINYRLQLSRRSDFVRDSSFEEHIINGKTYSFTIPSGHGGERWYWRVQARNYQVDDLNDHSGGQWNTYSGACSYFNDGYFDIVAPSDTTPNQFTFTDKTGAARNTTYTSNSITVSGINAATSISISGGTYSVNGGSYRSSAGTVNNGNTVRVRRTSSSSYSTTTSATLNIGGVSDTYSVTTQSDSSDTTPNQFTFTDKTEAALNTAYTDSITVGGINAAAPISISGGGGTYSINGGSYRSSAGTVNNGDTVTVKLTSSGSHSIQTSATLTIGGVSDIFTVTTQSDGGSGNGDRVNVALQANGGVATASSTYSSNYPAEAVNNGDRKGLNWGSGGAWADATPSSYPDWVQITFNGQKTISEIDVFTIQDDISNVIEPTATQTFSDAGITAFDVQYWNSASWVTVPGGSITGNNLVWRKITFPAVTTDRIRVLVNASSVDHSIIMEIEAYTSSSSLDEDFETGDFSKYPWQHSGNTNWTVVSYEGSYAAKSGTISHNQQSVLEITRNDPTANVISFALKVSSESNFDYLRFYIDGVMAEQWAGSVDWEEAAYEITSGEHVFKWAYEKDNSVSNGSDCVWIDDIMLEQYEPAFLGSRSPDFNGDGKSDLLWERSSDSANFITLMNGTSSEKFVYIPKSAGGSKEITGWADFNGDGKDDLLWERDSDSANFITLMNGTSSGKFVYIPKSAGGDREIITPLQDW